MYPPTQPVSAIQSDCCTSATKKTRNSSRVRYTLWQVKKAQVLAGIDIKARDLFLTAAAALREGGLFLLAHEARDDMEETVQLLGKVTLKYRCGGGGGEWEGQL